MAAADGTASASVDICNRGTAPVTLALALSDFAARGAGDGTFLLNTTRRLSADDVADRGIVEGSAELGQQRCVAVRLEVFSLWQAGLSTATLTSGTDKLADLQATNLHAPFHIKVDGPNPDKVELNFVDGEEVELRLRNEDTMGYRFRWRLELPGYAAEGIGLVRPNRSVSLPVCATSGGGVSWLESGFLRSATREGRLVVDYEPDSSLEPFALPRQSFPVQATISRYAPVLQRVWNTVFVVSLLLVGILASLLINYALPIQRRRVAAKQRLALLEGRLAGLGALVPGCLLSLLRVEKRRLREELRQLWPVDPTTEAAIGKFEVQMDWIERRIALVASAGDHLSALDGSTPLAVPEADQVRAACQTVFEVVEKPQATDEDIKRAQSALDLAAQLRATAALPPAEPSLKALGDRAAAVRVRVAAGADPVGHEAAYAELVQALLMDVPQQPPAALSVADYADVTLAVAKAEVVADFKHLLAGAQSADVRTRRTARAAELLAALCPGPEESLTRARDIVREAEQGVSEPDLVAALRAVSAADVWIAVDPPRPLPYQLVTLRVRMRQPGMDGAVARCRIECAWNVSGGDIESDDWVASYFFEQPATPGWYQRHTAHLMKRELRTPEPIKVCASLQYHGAELVKVTPVTVVIEPPKSYMWASTWLSLGAMFVTMLLVGIALVAGAQEKIQSLDWVAGVFAILSLGFGADVLKRVLTKP